MLLIHKEDVSRLFNVQYKAKNSHEQKNYTKSGCQNWGMNSVLCNQLTGGSQKVK